MARGRQRHVLHEDVLPPARLFVAPGPGALGDPRFRRLLDPADWARLPAAVRARFSKRLRGGESASYDGVITECAISRAGSILAQACRLIGAPFRSKPPRGSRRWSA